MSFGEPTFQGFKFISRFDIEDEVIIEFESGYIQGKIDGVKFLKGKVLYDVRIVEDIVIKEIDSIFVSPDKFGTFFDTTF